MAKNTLAFEPLSSEEGKTNGQSNQISPPSAFWFPVYEGLFEHCPKMLDAVWFFMWLIARTTRESNGIGKVLGGIPIRDDRPAGELGVKVKTLRRWRRMLVRGNYAMAVRTPYGFVYTLPKSKKLLKSAKRDFPKLPISLEENARNGHSDLPLRAVRVPETGRESAQSGHSNKTIQGQHKEEAVEEVTAAAASLLEWKTQKPWKAINLTPVGRSQFRAVWEGTFAEKPQDELLSDTMERCITACQDEGIPVPKSFYDAKRLTEKREARDSFPSHPIPEWGENEGPNATHNGDHSSKEKNQNERHLEAWEEIGIEPCGTIKFVLTWEEIWGDSRVGELQSVVMERCIQKCQTDKIQIPRHFYDRKHWIEDHEDPPEMTRFGSIPGVGKEYDYLVKPEFRRKTSATP